MKFLFIHNNYPGQFIHIINALAQNRECEIVFLSQYKRGDINIKSVRHIQLPIRKMNKEDYQSESHRVANEIFFTSEIYGKYMMKLKEEGFYPDVIYAHPGWGGSTYAPDIFPEAGYIAYCEWFYTMGENYNFFPDEQKTAASFAPSRQRNHCQLDALNDCDAAITPTFWQASQFPSEYLYKLNVLHDGIDINFFSPDEASPQKRDKNIVQGLNLDALPEIVTYATRGMEPYRGFPQFFKSIPHILEARPNCHIVIMAKDEVQYSAKRKDGKTWGEAMREEVSYDRQRVHFLKFGPYQEYRRILRASSVHIYLTVPFILSWSLLEAMSTGCLVVASATSPVMEVIKHAHNGFLTPFWDSIELAKRVVDVLENKENYRELRYNARKTIENHYNLAKLLPQHLKVVLGTSQKKKYANILLNKNNNDPK